MIVRILKHINAFRPRPTVPLLKVLYGPKALPLRTAVAALMLDRKVTGSSQEAQYGNLREALLLAVGATGNCAADEDSDFEQKAQEFLDGTRMEEPLNAKVLEFFSALYPNVSPRQFRPNFKE